MQQKRVFVTGGAGYVGSHVVALLMDRGYAVTVFDSLRQGHRAAVLSGAELIVGDLADAAALDAAMRHGPWHAVLHFAALSLVGESMAAPFLYLRDNLINGLNLIEACIRHDVKRFVLSSTANLFGLPDTIPIPDNAPVTPGSPYGESKWMVERALYWAEQIHGLRSAKLRYFNAAGADPAGRLGEDHNPETHLIPLAIDAALGRRPALEIFGTDYDTPDGTCIRDYIHVTDLADAHLCAMDLLDGQSVTFNIGTGQGHSVREILDAVGQVAGVAVPARAVSRRMGDPPVLVADASGIRAATGWQPRHATLEQIVHSAFTWRSAHPQGYADRVERVA